MVDVNKIRKDLIKLKKSMLKLGYKKDYVNQFLTETIEEVKNEG